MQQSVLGRRLGEAGLLRSLGRWPLLADSGQTRLAAFDPYRPIDAKRTLRQQSSDQVPERWLVAVNNACRRKANQRNLDQDRVSQYLADIPLLDGDGEDSQPAATAALLRTFCRCRSIPDSMPIPQCHWAMSQAQQVEYHSGTGAIPYLRGEPSSSAISAGMSSISTWRPCKVTMCSARKRATDRHIVSMRSPRWDAMSSRDMRRVNLWEE